VVSLSWRERGGPTVAAPSKTGFGSRLIEGVVRGELGGNVESRFTPQGFEADFSFQTVATR
jgi:two-component sensor histidine kinase